MKEYKRLTAEKIKGTIERYIRVDKDYILSAYDIIDEEKQDFVEMIINCLAELEDKIENGTLIELPCKYGDTVWFIYETENDKMFLDEGVIESFSIDSCGLLFYVIYKSGLKRWHTIENIGERVFLTKPEAKKKLEEINKNEK